MLYLRCVNGSDCFRERNFGAYAGLRNESAEQSAWLPQGGFSKTLELALANAKDDDLIMNRPEQKIYKRRCVFGANGIRRQENGEDRAQKGL